MDKRSSPPPDAPPFWNTPLAGLLAALQASEDGLSAGEALRRRQRFGPNVLQPRRQRPLPLQFLAHFGNPLVLVLLGASLVSALTGEALSFAIIGLILLFSVSLDFFQEHRAGRAAERLRQSVALRTTARRDGQALEIPVTDLVPGDVVLLTAGDLVPADGRVLESRDFFVNQALLTGEPYPVEKQASDLEAPGEGYAEAVNSVFMGSTVLSGMARMLVCRTGPGTAMGAIAEALGRPAPLGAFAAGIRHFGLLIMRLTLLLVLFVFLVNAWFQRPVLESLLFAIALAVGLTPELLPMVVSVTLARGALRLARQHVIVKRLDAINNLGSMDVLCTDKTGTLTEGRISLARHVDAGGGESEEVLHLAYLNSAFETGVRSPLDEAILQHGHIDLGTWRKLDEVPFDFERRRVSVLIDDGQRRLLVMKGAPEDVLEHCSACSAGGWTQPLDPPARQAIQALHDDLAGQGFRLLGIAWRQVGAEHDHARVDDETGLIFAGLAAFLDPPKASAEGALRALAASGVAVKIVTGDNERVARHLCTQLGLAVTGELGGHDLLALDDHALAARVEGANLFCRVTPSQKNRIILALKSRGHTVGYLGDGVNDAPPLRSADVGISVDGAVDVAREAASLILLKHDLGVLHAGVLEGRRTFGNIMKYILMGTSSNFGNMASMAGATLFIPFLPMLPVQILLNNLLYDLSEIPLPMDRVDPDDLARPRRWDMKFIRDFMWTIGSVSSLFDFLTFFILLRFFQAGEALFRTGWFMESMATQVLVIFVIRTRGSPLSSRPAASLLMTALAVVAVAVALPFTPFGHFLGFVPPPPLFLILLPAMVLAYLVLVQGVKAWFYRRAGWGARDP